MEFKYNNISYWISKQDTIADLLKRKDLISFPLSTWKDLLEQCYQRVNNSMLLKILKAKIDNYDISSEVNSFLINGNKFWLDKATRVSLMHLANCSLDTVQLVLGDQILTIPVDIAKNFLQQLEVYAGQCYLQTQKHLLATKELKTVEDIINYDYTKGYPEKITFNI